MSEDDLGHKLLNNSQKAEEQQRNRYDGQGKQAYCQICSTQQPRSNMYTVSQQCDRHHQFCFHCLIQKVHQAINRNEDIYCPVDYCPHILSELSAFFRKIPNNLHNKYVMWKASTEYLNRNKSFRESVRPSRASFNGNYFNAPPADIKQPDIPIKNDIQVQQNKKKEKKKKNKKQKKKPQNQQPKPVNQYRQIKLDQADEEQKMEPQIKLKDFAPMMKLIQQNRPQAMVPEIEYKWYHNVLKIILLVFGLPFMVILMVLLMLKMVLIFSVMICSVLGSMGCIVLISWSILKAFDTEDDEAWKEQWTNVYVLGLIQLVCLGFVRFFQMNITAIYYLVIKNSWIWWIQTLIKLWAYPYTPNIFYIRPQGVPTN